MSREDRQGDTCLASNASVFQGTITLILATDMARHGEILDSFKQKVDGFDYADEEHMTCVRTVASFALPVSLELNQSDWGLTEMFMCVFTPLRCSYDVH